MYFTSTFINNMIYAINNELQPENACAIKGFDTKELPIPLKSIFLSFLPEKNSVSYFENSNHEFCQKNEATIRMNCYAPLTAQASDIHRLTETVLDFINDRFILEFRGYNIGTLEYDSDVKAYKISCHIFYESEKCAADGSLTEALTVPANFFCKTHVTDTDIHVTAEEHRRLSSPYVTGTYTGQGYGTSYPIFLDFTPTAVFVFRQNSPPFGYDSERELMVNYWGFAIGNRGTKGIKIHNDDYFSITDTESRPVETRLNEVDQTYVYIAFR